MSSSSSSSSSAEDSDRKSDKVNVETRKFDSRVGGRSWVISDNASFSAVYYLEFASIVSIYAAPANFGVQDAGGLDFQGERKEGVLNPRNSPLIGN